MWHICQALDVPPVLLFMAQFERVTMKNFIRIVQRIFTVPNTFALMICGAASRAA